MKEMPVYLFTGFLGAGKTTFIQEVMESDEFNQGEKTLTVQIGRASCRERV